MTALLQIVPRLPPAIEGVGAYAAALGQALAGRGLASRYLVGNRGSVAGGLAASPIGERRAGALAAQLTATGARVVLLHYVNYGYQRRGCPAWLVGGVRRWRAGAAGRRLVTIFHEVYASGPPWRSSFWVSPIQRRLAARLLRASDGAATSLELYGRMLARWGGPRRQVMVTPVFSTLGEPAAVPAIADRRPRALVVFGGPGNRRRAWGEARASLAAACRALDIAEILDLGPPLSELPARLDGVPVRGLGTLPPAAASAVLLRSYAGFLAYPAPFLPKSTVFAAYCAHGLVPVCAGPHGLRRPPRPRPARPAGSADSAAATVAAAAAAERPPFWDLGGAEPAPRDPAELAARAHAWYAGHDLERQAERFHLLLADPVEAWLIPSRSGAAHTPSAPAPASGRRQP